MSNESKLNFDNMKISELVTYLEKVNKSIIELKENIPTEDDSLHVIREKLQTIYNKYGEKAFE